METKLNLYREAFNALAWQHMNHDRRREQMEVLHRMIDLERDNYAGSYRQTLEALIGILEYAKADTLTHTGVKAALRLGLSMVNQAMHEVEHFGYMLGTINTQIELSYNPENPDSIPF